MTILKIENFTKKYGKFNAVKNLSLSVNKGEIVGFVGKNGAGKSTTIRAIMNIIFPSEGKIEVCGIDCAKSPELAKKNISYMPSETEFYSNLKVLDVLSFSANFFQVNKEKITELASIFELDLYKKIKELSLGNRKKISVINAFLQDTPLIVLDEPTSGLDPLMQSKFFDILQAKKEAGCAIFLSSHNLAEIEKFCDRVIIIKDGKKVANINMIEQNNKQIQTVSVTFKNENPQEYDFDGDINDLVKELSKKEIASLEIKNKSIENSFIHYYEEDRDND